LSDLFFFIFFLIDNATDFINLEKYNNRKTDPLLQR